MANLGVKKIIAQAQAAAGAAVDDANQRQQQQFPQMVQPIQSYYPTPVTPVPVATPVTPPVMQGVAQVAPVQQQPQQSVVMNGLGEWLLYQLGQERNAAQQAQQATAQAQAAAQAQVAAQAQPPADYSQQAAAIQQWLATGGQNPGLPVGTQPTAQLPIQVLDLPTINNPVPGWSVPELQAQAAAGVPSGSTTGTVGGGYVPMGPYKLPDGSYTNEPPMGPYVPAGTPEAGTAEPAEPRRGRDRGGLPVGNSTADTDRGRDNGGNPVSTAEPQTEAPVPPGEDNAMFLMRPRGLSGPTGEREKAIQLTDYEGLADNARARRLSWEEYSRLTEDARRAADLNKLLVRSREDDLTRKKPMSGAREAQYNADVAEVFGPEGTKSDTVAPRVVGLLADLDINAVGKDLDDYLSLREGISADEIDKGSLQMDLANRVQFKAETAFQENPNKYWNLNSAIRDLDPKKAENAPPGFGGRKEPDEGWNDEKLYRNLWEGVQTNDPAWTVEKTKKLLNAANFNADDWTRLVEAMHLRAQNERLYAPSTSQTMSDDGKKRRSPDEILQFLAEVARAK